MAKNGNTWGRRIGYGSAVVGGIVVPLLGGFYQYVAVEREIAQPQPGYDTVIDSARRELRSAITRNTQELVRAIDRVETAISQFDHRLRENEIRATKNEATLQSVVERRQ